VQVCPGSRFSGPGSKKNAETRNQAKNNTAIFVKTIDFFVLKCYSAIKVHSVTQRKCDDQKPVGWKASQERCRLVQGKDGVLLEFILVAVR
jgi:hypothetical protein